MNKKKHVSATLHLFSMRDRLALFYPAFQLNNSNCNFLSISVLFPISERLSLTLYFYTCIFHLSFPCYNYFGFSLVFPFQVFFLKVFFLHPLSFVYFLSLFTHFQQLKQTQQYGQLRHISMKGLGWCMPPGAM